MPITVRPRTISNIMIYLLYDLILSLSALFLVPYYLVRGLRYGKARHGLRERLGWLAPALSSALPGRRVIWVHAVSVGETRAAIPLCKALRAAYPDALLVLSNVTETGRSVASEVSAVDHCLFFPFDLSWVVRRVLTRVRPDLVVLVETEIWPNFVRIARQLEVPLVLVNGRISDRSFPRYRLVGRLLPPILDCISVFCMQTARDARRIKLLGADPVRVHVTGNLKFDMAAPSASALDPVRLRRELRLPQQGSVWVAGSTHQGEEEHVFRTHQRLLLNHPDLVLILVPRHPERARQVCEEAGRHALTCVLRSGLEQQSDCLAPGEVLLVDSVGEMLKFYAVADIIFVGGSLVPVGGHNVLEASLLKKPVLFGPHMQNFKEIARLVRDADGGVQVSNAEDLFAQLQLLLSSPDDCLRLGEHGYHLLAGNQGATQRCLTEIVARVPR